MSRYATGLRKENNMDHKGTKEIETKRLLLRKFTKDDAEAMLDCVEALLHFQHLPLKQQI